MAKSKFIKFVEFEGGCFVPLNMALNKDGYFRKWWKGSGYEMFHRFMWRVHNNVKVIPKGYGINHKCNNRACCNPNHLELLSRKEHLELTNRKRYRRNILSGKLDFLAGYTRIEVADKQNVSYSTACKWANELGRESL